MSPSSLSVFMTNKPLHELEPEENWSSIKNDLRDCFATLAITDTSFTPISLPKLTASAVGTSYISRESYL